MSFDYLKNVPLKEAREGFLSALKNNGFASKTEIIPVTESCGRTTGEAVYAVMNAPHYPSSAMDGIALVAKQTYGATETTPVVLGPENYVMVDTGDPIPENFDAVVMIEDVVFLEDRSVKLINGAKPWQYIRQVGEDICAHEMILPSFTKITPACVGAMLAGGVYEVTVLKKPVVGIIPTGDEIVSPGKAPQKGEIIEFNSSIFRGMLEEKDCEVICSEIIPDKKPALLAALGDMLSKCDMVLLNAGSSAGRDDYASEVIGNLGTLLYHGISIKPGKPAILAHNGSKPIIGVPGYPVSGIVVLEELLTPVIDLWYGRKTVENEAIAVLSKSILSGLKYEEFVRVRLGYVKGKLIASPLDRGAGVVSSFVKADGIMRIPQNTEGFEAGDEVKVSLLRPLSELENTVVVTGSHDPLIDELRDILRIAEPEVYIASSHVGSMGAIMAAKRGESHLGGIHLLDETDGSYNESYIKKFFPQGGVRLIEGVGRIQGLMTAPGNPLELKGVSDLTKKGLRYVNRQKGSGTRVLIDYLCKKEDINTEEIYGYDREEYTHNAVAAQIAFGSGDTGMGIYSAAKIYGLDFIPVCNEQYDLLVTEDALKTESVQKVIEILKSDGFRNRLEKLGGYTVGNPGRIRF